MEHATKLMKRIIFLEGQPDLQVIPTLKVAANLEEVVKNDLEAEYEAVKLYREARALARDKGDYVSMELIEEILRDEEGHVDWLETQTSLIEAIGIANFAQLSPPRRTKSDPARRADHRIAEEGRARRGLFLFRAWPSAQAATGAIRSASSSRPELTRGDTGQASSTSSAQARIRSPVPSPRSQAGTSASERITGMRSWIGPSCRSPRR